mmetsp:Transcript_28196/g.58616  ORF Transcript_28196/g.58616 Transcript_28196/m.58616 type:complete len:200 (-) Transcript_28196:54-653(-)
MVERGHQVRHHCNGRCEFLGLDELVTARKVDRQDLHVLLFLGPSDEGRAGPAVLRFGTAGVVEADDAEFDIGDGVPEDLVLRNVKQESIFLLLEFRIRLNLCLQIGINLHSTGATGTTMVCGDLLLLLDHERLAAGRDAHPALVWPCSLQELVVHAFALLRLLLHKCAESELVLQGGRLDVLALLDQETLLESDFPHRC